MKLARISHNGRIAWALVDKNTCRVIKGNPFAGLKFSGERIGFKQVIFLPPAAPSKIVLVGLNYSDHARELGMAAPEDPVIFIKPATTLVGQGQDIVYPRGVSRLDYEGELAIVISRKARNLKEEEALKFVLGYTCLNDVTARDLQKKDIQWTRAKSFDTFCPLGPWLETELDPQNSRIRTYLNSNLKQDSSTANFIFPVSRIIAFVSGIMTLLPGDMISTGTPAGVGPMERGDEVRVQIEGVGELINRVV
jgi:2-keto-4-pentenoate hydratase/2-oxohepta-3-ene-1,7-dioic acid hydratase in catechol pathway